jgi:hypothetical protein
MFLSRGYGRRYHNEVCYERNIQAEKLKAGVLGLIKATRERFGFDGYLGLGKDHPLLCELGIVAAKEQPVEIQAQDFQSFAEQAMKENAEMSIAEVVEEWKKKNPEKPKVVTVERGNDNVSCITNPAAVAVPFPISTAAASPESSVAPSVVCHFVPFSEKNVNIIHSPSSPLLL